MPSPNDQAYAEIGPSTSLDAVPSNVAVSPVTPDVNDAVGWWLPGSPQMLRIGGASALRPRAGSPNESSTVRSTL